MEKIKLSFTQELVLNLLPKRKPILRQDAMTRRKIGKITGLKQRDISSIIEELRAYYPICSDRGCPGYWLGNIEELQKTINQTKSHVRGLQNTIDKLEIVKAQMLDDELQMLV